MMKKISGSYLREEANDRRTCRVEFAVAVKEFAVEWNTYNKLRYHYSCCCRSFFFIIKDLIISNDFYNILNNIINSI